MFTNYTAQGEKKFIRVFDGEQSGLYFFPLDAAYSIGYTRPYDAVRELISPKNLTLLLVPDEYGVNHTEVACNKAGLCELLNKSNKLDAQDYGTWIDTVVEPDALRKAKRNRYKEIACQNQF